MRNDLESIGFKINPYDSCVANRLINGTEHIVAEAELISFDDVQGSMDQIILNEQGYQVKDNIIYRDNQAAMKLEMNGNTSSGKRTRHFDIKYFS